MLVDFFNDLRETIVFANLIYREIFINDIKTFGIYLYVHTGVAFWNSWL